ncbi:MAG: DUF3574 domain-containing protein [Oscillospiraceae bacterium]|nr:DUF3574 domain-containing protein [Oscillospiraceae bacterium]
MGSSKEKSAFKLAVVLILIIETFALTGVIVYLALDKGTGAASELSYDYSENGKYVLYIGLNDKDTYVQIIPTEEAIAAVNGICVKYAEGYTVSQAKGGWVDETGALTEETSLIYTLSGVEEAAVISIMDEVLSALNQNSILVERQDITYTYYSGR